ncbi:MAG: M42 family metallopeptidase [Anaerolineales bacterium]
MKSLIQKLTETFAPSGYEAAIRDVIRAEVTSLADEIKVDALGNLWAIKHASAPGGKKIMLSAHMDEIGLIATHVDKQGFVRFTTIGGVRPHTLYGGRVRFVNGSPGVIGGESLSSPHELHSFDKLFIDVGATSDKDCPVKVGDVAAFERPFVDLRQRLTAKSMDDRIGVAVLIETLRALVTTPHEVYFIFSVQEEVGLRGATTAAFGVDPDIGIAVDVTGSGDTPKGMKMAVALGDGPAIKIKDGGMLADARVVAWMIATAKKHNLPYQREVLLGGTTDAKTIQTARSGVPAGCVSIPCRYVHSPSEMVDYADVQNAVRLLTAMLSAPVDLG